LGRNFAPTKAPTEAQNQTNQRAHWTAGHMGVASGALVNSSSALAWRRIGMCGLYGRPRRRAYLFFSSAATKHCSDTGERIKYLLTCARFHLDYCTTANLLACLLATVCDCEVLTVRSSIATRGSLTSLPGSTSGEMKLVEGLSIYCNGEMGNIIILMLSMNSLY